MALGLNQETLAVRAGISLSTLVRVEREGHIPKLSVLTALADALGLPLNELVDAAGTAA